MRRTDERRRFAEAIREFCADECHTPQQRDALTDSGKLADLGWLGVSIPEQYGGADAGMVEKCLAMEGTSRGLAPITAYSTGLTAAQTYLRYGTEQQEEEILGGLCRGRLEAIALSAPGAGSDLGAAQRGVRR
ncbi:acyl-CoA dehydrogenase family protein [Saccharopolyspora sp. NPDC002578]